MKQQKKQKDARRSLLLDDPSADNIQSCNENNTSTTQLDLQRQPSILATQMRQNYMEKQFSSAVKKPNKKYSGTVDENDSLSGEELATSQPQSSSASLGNKQANGGTKNVFTEGTFES